MSKKINNFLLLTLGYTGIFAILGLVLIIFPGVSLIVISYIIASLLIMNGLYLIGCNNEELLFLDYLGTGVLSLVLGIMILLYPKSLIIIIPIVIGIFIIFTSIIKIRMSLVLKKYDISSWLLTITLATLTLICGMFMALNPANSALTITTVMGLLLLVYSVTDFINILIFKQNIKSFTKYLTKN